VLHRREQEESRTALLHDVLWVEQNLQQHLDRNAEQLRRIALDWRRGGGLDHARLEERVEAMLQSTPGLIQVALLDPGGTLRAAAPGPGATPEAAGWDLPDQHEALLAARTTERPSYGPPYPVGREHHLQMFVPHYLEGAFAGTAVATYDLRALLSGLVPWWLAEKYRLTIRDAGGAILAARSNLDADERTHLAHSLVLDPPGHGLRLHAAGYRSETSLATNALALTIVGLAAAVLWSLWTLRRHVQRRLDAERELRREHAFRKAMEDSLETGMRAVDLEGRIVYVNPAFCRMVGYSDSELIGHLPPQPYWPADDVGRIQAKMDAARSGDAPRSGVEYEFVRRDGTRFDALLYEAPLVDATGRQTGWMGSLLDITERKRARERARQQEEKLAATARLVTMGEMASAIAHELNQPLSAIASYTTGCLNLLATGSVRHDDLAQALQKASQQAQRAGRIIRRVHQFVRKSEPTRQRVQLRAVVEEAVGFVQGDARTRRVRIRSGLPPDDVELDADPVLLQQVLLNLMRNGMEAMAATPPEQRELVVATELSGSDVVVRVADRGCGIAPEVQEKLFEPFFTTKPEGMGMGLNICRSIIEIHRGRVWAERGADGGTIFSFSLPLAERAA
jgi:two-component system sensor histidine kinase DctS